MRASKNEYFSPENIVGKEEHCLKFVLMLARKEVSLSNFFDIGTASF
jgi:hypothetical protein